MTSRAKLSPLPERRDIGWLTMAAIDQIDELNNQRELLRIAEEHCSWGEGQDIARNMSRIHLLLNNFNIEADGIIDSLRGLVQNLAAVLDHQAEDNTP